MRATFDVENLSYSKSTLRGGTMGEFILAVVFLSTACGIGLFVRFVALQTHRNSLGPKWLRWVGLVIGPVGILTGLGPVVGGFWVIGALGYAAMLMWFLILVAYLVARPGEDRLVAFSLTPHTLKRTA